MQGLYPPFTPLSWSKAISPRGRFDNPQATRPSGKTGRFSQNFKIPKLVRQEISSYLASLRVSHQIENIPLNWAERGDKRR